MGYIGIEEIFDRIVSKDLPVFMERLKNPSFIQSKVRLKGSYIALEKALYHIHKSSPREAKKECFVAGVNEFHLFQKFEKLCITYISADTKYICLVLLSDHEGLIHKIAHVGKDLDIPRRNKGSLNLMLQCAMRDDEAELRDAMAVYEKYKIKKEWDQLQLDFYEAYLEKDEAKIKEILTQLETPKLKKQDIFYREFIDDYLSVLITAYLKLCWRKGMPIHIDSPTVPMELMPIEPLKEYTIEYPYLRGWEEDTFGSDIQEEKPKPIYEEVGPYPSQNPVLRSSFVSEETIAKAVDHYCPNHTDEEQNKLRSLIWEAYTDPEHFDHRHKDYLKENNVHIPVPNAQGEQALELRPFWSELTEYDDEGFFKYCVSFMIMNEMSVEPDEVIAYLDEIKKDSRDKGGFFKRLFS